MVSIPLWKIPKYRGRQEAIQLDSNADENPGYSGVQESFMPDSSDGSEDEEQTSSGSTHHQMEDWVTMDSESRVTPQVCSLNEDGAGGDFEENIITTLSASMGKELRVQPMVVPECSLFGTTYEDQPQLIERADDPYGSLSDLPSSGHSAHSVDESVSTRLPHSNHSSLEPKRRKRKKKVLALPASESSVECQSGKESSPPVDSPQCVSEPRQESTPDPPESVAMETGSQEPQESSCTTEHHPEGSISSNPPQSPVEHQTTTSNTDCASAEPTTFSQVEDGVSNRESSIQAKCEPFYGNFKSTERYSFDVPLEHPDCARIVPVTYHLQKPSSYIQKMKDKAERRHLRKLSQQQKNEAHLASLPDTADGVRQFKQEPFFGDDCNTGETDHPPHHMEPSTLLTSAPVAGEDVPPVTQTALNCACLPLTPPEQLSERTLGTEDLSVKDLLSQFTEGNDEGTEEEKEQCTDEEEISAPAPHISTEACLPGGRGTSEMLPWLVSGESNEVSVGHETGSGVKVASASPPNLNLLTPTTLESLPSEKGMGSGKPTAANISNNFSSSPFQVDQTASESPLPLEKACEETKNDSAEAEGSSTCRDPNMEGDTDINDGEKKTVATTSQNQTEGNCVPRQETKRKVGRPRKTDKAQTAQEPVRSLGRRISARTAVASNKVLPTEQSASDTSVPAQKSPTEKEATSQEEGCAAFAAEGEREQNMDDGRDTHQSAGSKDTTAGNTVEGSSAPLQQVVKRRVGRPRKTDRSPPLVSVNTVSGQDVVNHSRKRTRSASEPASSAKRSRKSSSPMLEEEAVALGKDLSHTEVQPRRHSARLHPDDCGKNNSSTPDQPTSSQDPPERTATSPSPPSSAPPPEEKPLRAPITTSEAPVPGKKRGRKIKLRSAKQTAQQQQPTRKLLKGNDADVSQSPSTVKKEEPSQVGMGVTTGPSASADVQQGSTPSVDIPFTFNLEKNRERLSGALRLSDDSQGEPAAVTQQTPNPALVSFSFVVPERKTQSLDASLGSKTKVADSAQRPGEASVPGSDSPPPPLPQTPSSSISAYQASPANSLDNEAMLQEGVARKPEEGDMLELHPLGDFDDVSLLGDGAQISAGEFHGRQSKAVKYALKAEQKWFLKSKQKDASTHMNMPPNKLGINTGRVIPPPLPPTASPAEKNQRVRDWVEGMSREPPLPPPNHLLKTPDGPLQPEDDEEFVSASIINGPVVMATYREPTPPTPTTQHALPMPEPRGRISNNPDPPSNSLWRWKGFCRYYLLNVPCLRKPCFYQHCARSELPSEVLHHLAVSFLGIHNFCCCYVRT